MDNMLHKLQKRHIAQLLIRICRSRGRGGNGGKSLYKAPYNFGGDKQHRVAGDYRYVILQQMFGYGGALCVLPYKNGYVAITVPSAKSILYSLHSCLVRAHLCIGHLSHLILLRDLIVYPHLHIALCGDGTLLFRVLLCYGLVDLCNRSQIAGAVRGKLIIQLLGSTLKETVVECYDVLQTAPIGIKRYRFTVFANRPCGKIVQYLPVGIAPSVDALLYISHHNISKAVLMRSTTLYLCNKRLKVLPLHSGGILKLIQHNIIKLCAYLLINKWRVISIYNPVKQLCSICKQHHILLPANCLNLPLDIVQDAKLINPLQNNLCCPKERQSIT